MDSIRNILSDGIRGERSIEQYVRGIQLIYNLCFEDDMPADPSWLKTKAHKIIRAVLDRYDNPGSRRTRLAPFLAVCRKLGYSEAYQTYYEPFRKQNPALKELKEQRAEEEAVDDSSYMSADEIQSFSAKLARKVRQLSLEDPPRELTAKEVKVIMWHLVLAWHSLLDKEYRT
jgi:hypothetical protein